MYIYTYHYLIVLESSFSPILRFFVDFVHVYDIQFEHVLLVSVPYNYTLLHAYCFILCLVIEINSNISGLLI